MKLSVIVPSLNGEVPQSLRVQTTGRDDVELIAVQGVRPVGKARNEGLAKTMGDYVAWVDADDEVADDWLAEILTALERNPDALIFDAKNEGWPCMDDLVYGKPNADEVVRDVYEDRCLRGHLWRTVTRRALWGGVAFDETLCAMEDFLVLPHVLMRAQRVAYVPKALYRYICHEGSALTNVNARLIEDGVRAAIRRWNEAPAGYREAALKGSAGLVYQTLLQLNVDPAYRRANMRPDVRDGVWFLWRHWRDVRVGVRERLRFACAALNFWLPQRLAYWYHFGRRA